MKNHRSNVGGFFMPVFFSVKRRYNHIYGKAGYKGGLNFPLR